MLNAALQHLSIDQTLRRHTGLKYFICSLAEREREREREEREGSGEREREGR